jgi:two-component system chemotaxis sensor kinase CheA
VSNEDIEMINDFCRETETLLEPLENNIDVIKSYVFILPFDRQHYFNFISTLNIQEYLDNFSGINRVVHTIKGVSSFINLPKLNKFCHTAEDLTLSISKGKLILNSKAYEIIARIPVILNRFLETIKKEYSDVNIDIEEDLQEIRDCIAKIESDMDGNVFNLQEFLGKDFGKVRDYKREFQVTIDLSKYDAILQKFQAFSQDTMKSLYAKGLDIESIHTIRNGMTDHLNELIMSSLNKIVLTRYPRIVSDVSRALKKEIKMNITKNEAIARPDMWDKCHNALVHLVRNSLDHGIELPEEREKQGKDREGHINMEIHEDFKNIYISIEDDGKGIDGEVIAQAAVKKGAISESDVSKMTEEEKIKLIFRPNFSTKTDVTDVSGRGVGMDAVAKAIEESLKGKVSVKSEKNKGSHFVLEIPKAETMSECVIFGNDKYTYAIPMVAGIEYLECDPKYLKKVFNETPIYTEGTLELPLLNVFKALHPSEYEELSMEYMPIIKIDDGTSSFGLVAPRIIGQERIKVVRNSAIKKASMDSGQIFGYGLTDPVTVVLDLDHLMAMV